MMDPLSLDDLAAHHRRVRGLVASLVGDPDLGEDAVQGAWVKLLEGGRGGWPQHLGAWLGVTAQRVAWNERRGERRRRDREQFDPRMEALPSSVEIAERAEISARVLGALDVLGEPHESVLRDHYLGGLTAAQLASRDGLPLETVRSRLRRARAAFRARLEADGLGGDVHWSLAAAPLVLDVPLSSLAASGAMVPGALGAATGWIAMKKLAVTALLVVSVLLGIRWLMEPADPNDARELAALESGVEFVSVGPAAGESEASGAAEVAPGPGRSAVELAPAAAELHRVRGQVVDADGLPIDGAVVVAAARDEWPGSAKVISPREPGVPRSGFETRSGREGTFWLELPLPRPRWVSVSVSAGRHRTFASKVLANGGDAGPVAGAEPEDLGTMRLGVAGAILGRVTARDGSPIAGAELSINSKKLGAIGEDAVSGADGRYVLGHNPAGEFAVRVTAEGYYQDFREGVVMELGQDTPGVDFVLGEAPCIAGRLVDQHGAGVEGATVMASARAKMVNRSGFGSRAVTGPGGAFRIHAARPAPHELSVRADEFEKMKGQGVMADPGDDDVLVVVHRLPVHTIRVLDDETGAPLETFGARARLDWGGLGKFGQVTLAIGQAPRPKGHPGGIAALSIRVGVDSLEVASPGYESAMGAFALDEGSSELFTVRLKKCPVVTGRVLLGGEPVVGATVVLDAAKKQRRWQGEPVGPAGVFLKDKDRWYRAVSGVDGRFEIPTFGPGRVRLMAQAETAASAMVLDLTGANLALGDLELEPYGVVEGQVLVPDGQSPAGLRVWLDEWSNEVRALTGSGGRFRLERVVPGLHQLVLRGRDPELESMTGDPFDVRAGEVAHALLDASSFGRAELNLTILVDGQPASGVKVDVGPGGVSQDVNTFLLGTFGTCDEFGRVRGHCRTYPRVSVAILGRYGQRFHPEVFLTPRLGEVLERKVEFETTEVSLVLPEHLVLPAEAYVKLEVLRSDRSTVLHERSFMVRDGKIPWAESKRVGFNGGVLTVGGLLVGPQVLRLTVQDQAKPATADLVDGEYVLTPGPNDFVLEGDCTLRSGAANEVALPGK